ASGEQTGSAALQLKMRSDEGGQLPAQILAVLQKDHQRMPQRDLSALSPECAFADGAQQQRSQFFQGIVKVLDAQYRIGLSVQPLQHLPAEKGIHVHVQGETVLLMEELLCQQLQHVPAL